MRYLIIFLILSLLGCVESKSIFYTELYKYSDAQSVYTNCELDSINKFIALGDLEARRNAIRKFLGLRKKDPITRNDVDGYFDNDTLKCIHKKIFSKDRENE
jgi:hypothetical protein